MPAAGITTERAVLQVNTGTVAAPIWTDVIERSQIQDGKTGATIDMTSFDDAGFSSSKPGLRSSSINASGNYVPSDAGYLQLETAWLEGIVGQVRFGWRTSDPGVLPLDYTGWRIDAIVTDLGTGGNAGDKVELSLALQGSGKPEKVTFQKTI